LIFARFQIKSISIYLLKKAVIDFLLFLMRGDIMGKSHLTLKELRQFPTLQKLVEGCEGKNSASWGLCKNNDGDISFGEAAEGWVLLVSLDGLFECGVNITTTDVVLFYAVEWLQKEETFFEFIVLSNYEDTIKTQSRIEWSSLQN
jgi:hypothetical protein